MPNYNLQDFQSWLLNKQSSILRDSGEEHLIPNLTSYYQIYPEEWTTVIQNQDGSTLRQKVVNEWIAERERNCFFKGGIVCIQKVNI